MKKINLIILQINLVFLLSLFSISVSAQQFEYSGFIIENTDIYKKLNNLNPIILKWMPTNWLNLQIQLLIHRA